LLNNMQNTEFKIRTMSQSPIIWIFIIIAGLILPLFLIPLIKFTGFSEIIEEIAKALVILFIILKLPSNNARIFAGVGFGLLFGLSESMFYLNNIFQLDDFSIFVQRFLWTVPMHIITVLVMVSAGLMKRWFLVFGFIIAVILHLVFNSLITNFLI